MEILAAGDRGQAPCSHVASLVDQRLRDVDQRLCDLQVLKQEPANCASGASTELSRRSASRLGETSAGSPYCRDIVLRFARRQRRRVDPTTPCRCDRLTFPLPTASGACGALAT